MGTPQGDLLGAYMYGETDLNRPILNFDHKLVKKASSYIMLFLTQVDPNFIETFD